VQRLGLVGAAGNRAVTAYLQRRSAARGGGARPWVRPFDRGPDVVSLKAALTAAGEAVSPGDQLDSVSIAALQRFQSSRGLSPDGICGPLTWEGLDRATDPATAEADTLGQDLTGGAMTPTEAETAAVDKFLNPKGSGSGAAPTRWDAAVAPDPATKIAKKEALVSEVHKAMQDHLNANTPKMKKAEANKAAGRTVSLKNLEGAGEQAKRVVDAVFGGYASAAALTDPQRHARDSFAFKAGVNLQDASDPTVRPPDAEDQADWIGETDVPSRDAASAHDFDKHRATPDGELSFWENQVVKPFIATGSNKADLERYDQFGFAVAAPGPRILTQVTVRDMGAGESDPSGGVLPPPEREKRWTVWQIMVHEYLHTLAHPTFNAAHRNRRVLFEGICEYLTKAVLLHGGKLADAKADGDKALRLGVEGGDVPGFDAKLIRDYSSDEYKPYVDAIEGIEAALSNGKEAIRSAFLLGHVENLGLQPNGDPIKAGSAEAKVGEHPDLVVIPSVIGSVGAVSILTGAAESAIVAANPGLAPSGPLPPTAHSIGLHVPGTSKHRVLKVSDRTASRTERSAEVAQQHGITLEALERANPGLHGRPKGLKEGEHLLVPVH